jgi:16S rRNA G966 N2-methylase RsmD
MTLELYKLRAEQADVLVRTFEHEFDLVFSDPRYPVSNVLATHQILQAAKVYAQLCNDRYETVKQRASYDSVPKPG